MDWIVDTGDSRRQGNKYDKIFRENMEAALPAILKHLLGMEIAAYETLTDEIQHTRERKPDVLRRVTDNAGKTFVLHLECQVKNEKDMALRMAE
jgi:hypothetical protein